MALVSKAFEECLKYVFNVFNVNAGELAKLYPMPDKT
jgi:hypothetical protein